MKNKKQVRDRLVFRGLHLQRSHIGAVQVVCMIRPFQIAAAVALCISSATATFAADAFSQNEPARSGWQLFFDNDLLLGDGKDRDYTGGMALSLSGADVAGKWYSPEPLRRGLDRLLRLDDWLDPTRYDDAITEHSFELGITLFTPENISADEPQNDDHPYANVFFVAASRRVILPLEREVRQSTLMLGLLGTSLGEKLQKGIHVVTASDLPRGWDHQISAGGEPTFRYTLGWQRVMHVWRADGQGFDMLGGVEASVGGVSDVALLTNFRLGLLESPWWSFLPHQAEYISLGSTGAGRSALQGRREVFVWGGAELRLRLYNVIFQGQFRHSEVTFDSDQLNHLIADGWLGITWKRSDGWGLSLVGHMRSSELKHAPGPVWGSVVVSYTY